MSVTRYHLPALAAMAGIAIAATGYVFSSNSPEFKRRRRKLKAKYLKERDGLYILGLVNTGNSCYINSVLHALATLSSLRSYLAERVDECDNGSFSTVPPNEFIIKSLAFALYTTVELLNKPLARPRSISPVDFVNTLEEKANRTLSQEQQDAQELFQLISSLLTTEEEEQYREQNPSLLDCLRADQDASGQDIMDNVSVSSVGTIGSMWSSYSVSATSGYLRPRTRRPRNPFTGLLATKISCVNCGYTAPIRHHTFDNITLHTPMTGASTLERCLNEYTQVVTLTDYRCRKCCLTATLESLSREMEQECQRATQDSGKDAHYIGRISRLEHHMRQIKDALENDVEASLDDISLVTPSTPSRVTKQTLLANPPKALCLHLSRSIYNPLDMIQKNHCHIQFAEELDLAPYCTTGFLNTSDPQGALNSPMMQQARTSRTGLVYLRNLSPGYRFVHGRGGLNVALTDKNGMSTEPPTQYNALPSMTLPAIRPIRYRLTAVIVHHGSHNAGHLITYRRKKLPTGHEVREPWDAYNDKGPSSTSPTQYWCCSDESVELVDQETVLSSNSYMLLYERDDTGR